MIMILFDKIVNPLGTNTFHMSTSSAPHKVDNDDACLAHALLTIAAHWVIIHQPAHLGIWCTILKTMVLSDVWTHECKDGINGKLISPTSWCNHFYNHKPHNLLILTHYLWMYIFFDVTLYNYPSMSQSNSYLVYALVWWTDPTIEPWWDLHFSAFSLSVILNL